MKKVFRVILLILFFILPVILLFFVLGLSSIMSEWSPLVPGYNYFKWSTVFLLGGSLFCLVLYIPVVFAIVKKNLKFLLIPLILFITFIIFGIILNNSFEESYTSKLKANIDSGDIQSVLQLANRYLNAMDYDDAIIYYDKALEINPNDPFILHDRGLAYSGKKDYEKAVLDFSSSINLKSDEAQFYNDRAVAYFFLQDYVKSKSDVDQAIRKGYNVNPSFIKALEGKLISK